MKVILMKEKSDEIERELKILGPVNEEKIISIVRESGDPSWNLVKTLPEVIFDLYLDTPDFALYENNLQFRLRRRKRAAGWNSSFKGIARPENAFVARRKIQSRINYEEALRFQSGDVPGAAAKVVYEQLQSVAPKSGIILEPKIHLVSYRTRYKVMVEDFTWGDDTAGRQVLFLAFEKVCCFDVQSVDQDIFINHGWFDYSHSLPNGVFSNTEFEARGDGLGMEDEASNLLMKLSAKLANENIPTTKKGKYAHTLEMLVPEFGNKELHKELEII